MLSRILCAGTFLIWLAACCHKPIEEALPTSPTPAGLAPLSAVYEIDSLRSHDTVASLHITYDIQQRPLTWTYVSFYYTGDSMYYQHFTYHYATPQDSLADYSVDRRRNMPGTITEEIVKYYTWSNGQLVKDSAVSSLDPARNYVSRYMRQADWLDYERTGAGIVASSRIFGATSNGNPSWQMDTLLSRVPGNPYHYRRNEFNTTYLPMLNPFYVLSRPVLEPMIRDSWSLDTWFNAPRHLINERVYATNFWMNGITGSSYPETTTYQYTYDAAGRPVQVRSTTFPGSARLLSLHY